MTKLQRLAINRIKELVSGIDLQMTAYALHRDRVEAECSKADRESCDKWSKNSLAKAEAVAWADALMAERADA